MTPRRSLLGALVGIMLFTRAGAVRPQTAALPRRIGVLALSPAESATSVLIQRLLRESLQRVGFEDGRNLAIEWRFAQGSIERLPGLAAELVGLRVELIVALQNDAIAAASQATRSIPIVMAFGSVPVEAGFIHSLARPGTNVSGTVWVSYEIAGKNLEILKLAAPQAVRVAYLSNPTVPGHKGYEAAAFQAARVLALRLQAFAVTRPEEIGPVLERIAASRPDALFVVPDSVVESRVGQIADFAIKHKLVTLGTGPQLVDAGGLLYYGPEVTAMLARTASYIERILHGASPAELPVELPTHFEMVINMKTAKALGLTLPQGLLLRADRVIE